MDDPFDIDNESFEESGSYKPLKRNLINSPDGHSETDLREQHKDKIQSSVNGAAGSCSISTVSYSENNQVKDSQRVDDASDKRIESNNNGFSRMNEETKDPFDISDDFTQVTEMYKPLKKRFKYTENYNCDMEGDVSADPQHSSSMTSENCGEIKRARVAYVYSDELKTRTNQLIRIEHRAELVHNLIRIYGLLQYIKVLEPRLATETEILGFHSTEYLHCLQGIGSFPDSEDLPDSLSCEADDYGISYDCPQQAGIFETASLISGATITAAESLLNGTADIAINWYGGWHHAKRDSASGFCYINDIVLGILKLKEKFDRVLYVDLDLHHGDGVEEAFEMTPKVMTVSFHKFSSGFFPGTGSLDDVGCGKGKYYSVNVPLKDGIKDAQFFNVFCSVMKMVKEKFSSQAIVIQCGADSLSEDPMASFNLTHIGLAKCVCYLLAWKLPTLLLGGGGYNFPNTAKCWTFLTGLAAGKKLPTDIPEHEHLLEYGPSYELTTTPGNRKDSNSRDYLSHVISVVTKNLRNI